MFNKECAILWKISQLVFARLVNSMDYLFSAFSFADKGSQEMNKSHSDNPVGLFIFILISTVERCYVRQKDDGIRTTGY